MTHAIVPREEWLDARRRLLAKEKDQMKAADALKREVRALPWMRIEKDYRFRTTVGEVTLAELFRGRSQLFVKHFMMGPGQDWQCVGCSLEADHVDGLLPHLEHHDISYVAVARAPIEEIEAVRKRMGWRFPWVSSAGSDFNYDIGASFRPEDMANGSAQYNFGPYDGEMEDLSGNSVFFRDAIGAVFLTYQTFGRGGEQFLGIYAYLDVVPKGREENGPNHALTDWVKLHDAYHREDRADARGAVTVG